MLKNPFGLRNEKIIVIGDLTEAERGLRCNCKCPNCGGGLIARMGEIKIPHFSHSKGACDETLAFIAGLFGLIMRCIEETGRFYLPSLAVAYELPYAEITMDNVAQYVKIIPEWDCKLHKRSILISKGKTFTAESVKIAYDAKNHAEALIITTKNRELAICVIAPSNCKAHVATPYKDFPTLVLDARDIKFHTLDSETIKSDLIEGKWRWTWLSNAKVKDVYTQIYGEYLKQQEKLQIAQERQRARQVNVQLPPIIDTSCFVPPKAEKHYTQVNKEKRESIGYEQVKGLFTQQKDIIRDSFSNRWVQCEICGQIKPDSEFSYYGGINHVNLGECSDCVRKKVPAPNG